jgi:tetratricopeptide (TPR) repeat protein
VILAPAAVAQNSTKEFVDAYTAAKTLIEARKWNEALPKIDAAAAQAKSNKEKSAVAGMRVLAYSNLKKNADLIKAIEAHQALGGLPPAQLKNYKEMLAGAHDALGHTAQAMELTKELVGEGGGTSVQLAYIARASLAAKKYDDAITYANKAIEAAKKEGKKPANTHYNILLNAYVATGKMPQYYTTLERAAPIFNSETYWRPLVEKSKKEPKFKSDEALLDVYRALEATGAKLTDQEKTEMAEMAFTRRMPVEAERLLTPLVKAGSFGGAKDPKAQRNKKMYDSVVADAKAAKAGGLEKAEAEAAGKQTGDAFVAAGEGYFTAGNYAKAAEAIQKGIDKGALEPGALELAKVRLGMAQYKAGKKDDARKTWATVTGDNGAAQLAKVWTLLSKG